jgi:hypothetical protein
MVKNFREALWFAANDYYSVYLLRDVDDVRSAKRVVQPRLSYLADPFLARLDSGVWLLAECFDYIRRKGRLVAAPLDALERFTDLPLNSSTHASFPFVFEFGGENYLLPETSQAGQLDVYRLVGVPPRAEYVRSIFSQVDCVDSVVFPHHGLWWLMTMSSLETGKRALRIYHAETPLAAEWTPHPINDRNLFAMAPNGTGRNAGNPHLSNGRILVPIQTNPNYYGEVVVLLEILHLTPDEFEARPLAHDEPGQCIASHTAMHHRSRTAGWTVYDRREPAPLQRILGRSGKGTCIRTGPATEADRAFIEGFLKS